MKYIIFILLTLYSSQALSFFAKEDPIWFPSYISLSTKGHTLEEIDSGFTIPALNIRGTNYTGHDFNDQNSLAPIVGGDLTMGSKVIISLEGTSVIGENGELLLDKGSKGYLVIEKSAFHLTLGAELGQSLGSTLGVSIGLAGSFGKELVTRRFVKDKNKLKRMFIPKIPTNKKMLTPMSIGDSYSYTTHGGVSVSSNIGAFSVGAGGGLSIQGIWNVEVQKSGINKAIAVITKQRITNVKASAGVPLTSLSVAKIKKSIKSYIYEFDLSGAKGEELYKSFLKGNIKKVQDELKNNTELKTVAKPLIDTKGNFFSSQLSASISIPLGVLGLGVSGDKITSFLTTKVLDKDLIINSYVGIYKRNSFFNTNLMKFLSKFKRSTVANFDTKKIFMGHVKEFIGLKNRTNKQLDTWGANLNVQVSGDSFTKKGFKYAARKMTTWTGFDDVFLKIESPQERLGYIELNLDVSFSNKAIEELIYFADFAGSLDKFSEYATIAVENYADKTDDPFNYCSAKVTIGRFPRTCKKRILVLTKAYMKQAYNSLIKMKGLLAQKKYKKLSKELSHLGKGMTHNHFTLKTLWWMMKNKPIEAKIVIQGEGVKRYEKVLRTFSGQKIKMESFAKDSAQKMWD